MAEAVLEVVLGNLNSLLQNELQSYLGFNQNLQNLSSKLSAIKATLEDAEKKQFSDKAVQDWLQKLKDAAHVLDDILDDCATEALEMEYEGFKVKSSRLASFHPKHVAFRYRVAKKMKKISERLDEIAEEKSMFYLSETVGERRTEVIDWRQTTSIISQPQVYGREEDKLKIIDFLVTDASNMEDLSVYPIVGIGGLGKTTLAQLTFNHERVVNHFELRIWVCVSDDFSLKRMTKAIIESASGCACADLDLEPLQRRLQDLLRGKTYLLVLDDVWDDDQENWMRLKSVLSSGAKGSSILVTTRISKVATVMGTRPPHELSTLSDNDCWELFKQRAFGANEVGHTELLKIGKEIVNKCGGVPLAAIALGSLLRFKREEKEWIYIKESELWSLEDEKSIIPALRLSYLNLAIKLRQCFAFCAIFPKDERISKHFLIKLWIANGFISSNAIMDAEEVGDVMWNELHWRSFFQDIEPDVFGKITFKMHDLVHDLAQSVTSEVGCITNDSDVRNLSERIRHLSFSSQKSYEVVQSIKLHKENSLKTLIMLPQNVLSNQLSPDLFKCYSLRVLDFPFKKDLPSSIGHLRHLRYLKLSHGSFETLPESICNLWNLQMLYLDFCDRLQTLPDSLTRLKALRHLSLRACNRLLKLPPNIGKLTSLRILSMYFVDKKKGFFLSELGQLNLKQELHIKYLERVKGVMDAKNANMSNKHLTEFRLSWGRNKESELQENVEEILEVLQPHSQKLQTLGIGGYRGPYFPQWVGSPSFRDLYRITLLDCSSCLYLPTLGKLPSLKHLKMCKMNELLYIENEAYDGRDVGCFMALESFVLSELSNLKRLSREDGENMFPHLSSLTINECPKLSGLPCLPSLKYLQIRGKCNQDLISSIHKFHSLESLHLKNNEVLTRFPEGMLQDLTSLKKLGIYGLSKLEALPTEMINLSSLENLYIWGCSTLVSIADGVLQALHSLKILEIQKCHKFKLSAGFQYLTCLEELVFVGSQEMESFEEVESFDEALEHKSSLQYLVLYNLPNLRSLPDCLGNLASLQRLIISGCPKLTCLPMTIRRLSALKILRICSCPELERRCQKETGEDWPLIAHVQNVEIENKKACYSVRSPEPDVFSYPDNYEL